MLEGGKGDVNRGFQKPQRVSFQDWLFELWFDGMIYRGEGNELGTIPKEGVVGVGRWGASNIDTWLNNTIHNPSRDSFHKQKQNFPMHCPCITLPPLLCCTAAVPSLHIFGK